MLLWIIVAITGCAVFGLPILPVLVVGGLLMSLTAYYLTRYSGLLNLAIGLFIVAGSHYLVGGLLQDMPDAIIVPAWVISLLASDLVVGITSVIVILLSAVFGIFGPMRHVPTDAEGVLRMVKDCEKKLENTSK